MVVRVRHNCWYISLPSAAKKKRLEMNKFCVVWTTTHNFQNSRFELYAIFRIQFRVLEKRNKLISFTIFEGKTDINSFY